MGASCAEAASAAPAIIAAMSLMSAFQVLLEERERALPRKPRGRLVVARRRVVVEAMVRAGINVDLGFDAVRLQRGFERRDAGVGTRVFARVVREDRCADPGSVLGF